MCTSLESSISCLVVLGGFSMLLGGFQLVARVFSVVKRLSMMFWSLDMAEILTEM